jgi:hypothetical protein
MESEWLHALVQKAFLHLAWILVRKVLWYSLVNAKCYILQHALLLPSQQFLCNHNVTGMMTVGTMKFVIKEVAKMLADFNFVVSMLSALQTSIWPNVNARPTHLEIQQLHAYPPLRPLNLL